MIRIGILLSLVASCRKPEDAISRLGGKSPIVCLMHTAAYDGLTMCRDGIGAYWICDTRDGPNCAPATYPATAFTTTAEVKQ